MVYLSNSSNAAPVYLVGSDGQVANLSNNFTLAAGGYQRVTATGSVFPLPSPPAGTRRAIIQAEGGDLRWRDDGTDPTATVGMRVLAGGELRYDGADMSVLKLFGANGTVANISYYA
jgi:hypothetical protein